MGLVELMGASGSQRRITKSIPYMEEREPDPPDCIITGITNTYVVIQVIKSEGCHYASHADLSFGLGALAMFSPRHLVSVNVTLRSTFSTNKNKTRRADLFVFVSQQTSSCFRAGRTHGR